MGNTPNWNIYYAENGAPADARTESATQAGTVEAALDSVGGDIVSVNNFGIRYFANASARDLALTSPSVGWLTQLDSELFMRRWDGAAWKPYGSGLFPIIPSSASGAGVSVGSDGVVNFSSATAVNIDGVFSSDFRDYQIEFEATGASVDMAPVASLRTGSANTTSGYNNHYAASAGSSIVVDTSGLTSAFNWGITPGRIYTATIFLKSPAAARTTVARTQYAGFNNAGGGYSGNISGRQVASTSFDGVSISPNSGNMTGSVRIFGMA